MFLRQMAKAYDLKKNQSLAKRPVLLQKTRLGPLFHRVAMLGPDREEVCRAEGGEERRPLHRDRPRRNKTAQGTWSTD